MEHNNMADRHPEYTKLTERFSYNPFDFLGGGIYGDVYRGWDLVEEQAVAVKHITRAHLKDMDGIEQR
jgi:hypothetical protein